MAQEIGGVDASVFREEIPVATAAIHHVGIELAAEFRTGFHEDARQIQQTSEFLAETWQFIPGDRNVADLSFLLDEEMIPAHGSHQQRGAWRRFALVHEILNEIEKLPFPATDAFEKGDFLR